MRRCYESWGVLNPDWEITLLDQTNLTEFMDLTPITAKQPLMEKAALSDIIRANLLAQHGGVWVDATCYCRAPLDSWLPSVTKSGFFAFSRPVKQSLVAVWFMAVSQGNPLMESWAQQAESYVLNNPGLAQRPKTRRWFKWFDRNVSTTRYWFAYPLRRVFRVYPYYWFMYLLAKVVREDPASRMVWQQVPKIEPPNPGRLHKNQLLTPVTEKLKEEIEDGDAPVYKLTWRYDPLKYSEASVLAYILARPLRTAETTSP